MKTGRKSSDILCAMLHEKHDGDLSFKRILELLGERAFGIAILFFALPSLLPLSSIPGISFIFSVPILLLALQLMIRRKTVWLPYKIAQRRVSHHTIQMIVAKGTPILKKLEHFLKPRFSMMTSPAMEILNGLTISIVSILLMLPIPFSNFILAGIIIIFSLGLMEKDGVYIIAGYIGTIIYISFIYLIIISVIQKFI